MTKGQSDNGLFHCGHPQTVSALLDSQNKLCIETQKTPCRDKRPKWRPVLVVHRSVTRGGRDVVSGCLGGR